jgi:hypothetical protein
MVSITTLREAFEIISAVACGANPARIRVVVPTLQEPRTFVVAFPAEHRTDVYHFLAERIDLSIPLGGDPLVLSGLEAAAVLKLAIELAAVEETAMPGSVA